MSTATALDPANATLRKMICGRKVYLGVLICTSTSAPVSNSSTATPFTIPAGEILHVEADAACYYDGGTTSVLAIAACTSLSSRVAANDYDRQQLLDSEAFLAVQLVSAGTINLKVFALRAV